MSSVAIDLLQDKVSVSELQEPAGNQETSAGTGVLPCQDIRQMINGSSEYGQIKTILTRIDDDQIQPASIDLRLGDYAYPIATSFLPDKGVKVFAKMKQLDERFDSFKIDLREGAVLSKDQMYVIPLQEAIYLKSEVGAVANPKSSTGRLDILTRLITDEGTVFDEVEPGYKGELYVEVVSRSFPIVAKTGARLNQLRFRRMRKGIKPREISPTDWKTLVEDGQIINTTDKDKKKKLLERAGIVPFTIDLKGNETEGEVVGWKTKKHTQWIDLEKRDYDPLEFWEPICFSKNKPATLILYPDEFFILMTSEEVGVPNHLAAEMVPYDTRAGEFRVHYAGFFDPGFGWNPVTKKAGSSRGVLEVRSHEVPFLLEHGQTVGWLRYERMSEAPDSLYGQQIASNYQGQSLKLAKQFRS